MVRFQQGPALRPRCSSSLLVVAVFALLFNFSRRVPEPSFAPTPVALGYAASIGNPITRKAIRSKPRDWFKLRRQSLEQLSSVNRVSEKEWARLYRHLGLEEGSSRERVAKAVNRLRKKYASDEQALERVENANFWIMTKITSEQGEEMRSKQKANRLRENGHSSENYLAGYVPAKFRKHFEVPSLKHFRTTTSLMGAFALLGMCAPTQATNFVSFAVAACLGLVYQRNSRELVKDDMGNVGEVRKIDLKEMGTSLAITATGLILGAGIATGASTLYSDIPFMGVFCLSTCVVLWLLALFARVRKRS